MSRSNARPGNRNAITHGASSEARIRPVARTQKRRLLRQIGLSASDLDGIGRALLDNWASARRRSSCSTGTSPSTGSSTRAGEPVPATKLYFVAVNSARLALSRLHEHLIAKDTSPLPALEGEGRRLRLEAEQRLRAVE